ncbi:MAG: hypothetical protein L0211_22710 [Planctomycetaceae bacterium]|nr:hypothetical protein [Planctomycetaceae bacterium]
MIVHWNELKRIGIKNLGVCRGFFVPTGFGCAPLRGRRLGHLRATLCATLIGLASCPIEVSFGHSPVMVLCDKSAIGYCKSKAYSFFEGSSPTVAVSPLVIRATPTPRSPGQAAQNKTECLFWPVPPRFAQELLQCHGKANRS